MAKPIMIQGTMSNAGKSLITAALCRIFRQDGFRVAPFKSQNMALNSFITEEGLEMGRAQVMQAEAAGVKPTVLMNPILLKPTTDVGSQVIIKGRTAGDMSAKDYFVYKKSLVPIIAECYAALAAENDVIVIEGAGSPAEINLKNDDIVNMGMAKLADSPVFLVGDIDRGGVFAQLYGTVELLEPDERARVKGLVINKFRGDAEILKPGLVVLEKLTGIPVAGVVPYAYLDIGDEDSLSERLNAGRRKKLIDIAVIRLPRLSNFTDFDVFGRFEEVSLRYVAKPAEMGKPDMVIIPGTKSTIADLLWMRQNGLEAAVIKMADKGMPIFGICGGLQILGRTIEDPEGAEGGGKASGMGLLDIDTRFSKEKIIRQASGKTGDVGGIFSALSGLGFSGYEIHMGRSAFDGTVVQKGNIYGSYIHGIFDGKGIAQAVVSALAQKKGVALSEPEFADSKAYKEEQYDKLADLVRKSLDMRLIYSLIK